MYYEEQEETIDIIGLFIYVCKQWRKLLIFFLIGAVIGSGISFYKMQAASIENIEKKLSKIEAKEPDKINKDNIQQYADYKLLYESMLERGQKSFVLNMDENSIYKATAKYFVSCSPDDIDEVEAYYASILNSEQNLDNLIKLGGLDITRDDIGQMVALNFSKYSLDNQIISDFSLITSRNATVTISVVAPTEKSRDAMFTELKAVVIEASKELTENMDGIVFKDLSEDKAFGYNSGIANYKTNYQNTRRTTLEQVTKSKSALSDDEKLYYAYHFDRESLEEGKAGFSKKWPVIAAVGCAFIAACVYVVIYIFDKHIKEEDEITEYYGLQVLGSVDFRNAPKVIFDKWFYAWEKSRRLPANSIDYISSIIKAIDSESIALVSAGQDLSCNDLADSLLREDNRLVNAGNVLSDNKAYESIDNINKLIVIVHIADTTKQELVRILELAKKFDKEICGVVVVR